MKLKNKIEAAEEKAIVDQVKVVFPNLSQDVDSHTIGDKESLHDLVAEALENLELEMLRGQYQKDFTLHLDMGCMFANLDETDKAITYLNRALLLAKKPKQKTAAETILARLKPEQKSEQKTE